MADYGLKVSKAGDDVKAVSSKDLRFDSEKGAFKIFKSGDVSFTTNGSGDGSVNATHGAGYPPAIFAYRKGTAKWTLLSGSTEYTNSYFPVGSFNSYVKDDTTHQAIHCYADDTKIYIEAKGGKASTTMDFRYYCLIDQSADYSGADSISTPNDYGFKVAKPGYDIDTAKEYELAFSSKYKILQYHEVSKKKQNLTLPIMFTSYYDQFQEEATYVDFTHGLGYQPLCFVWADSPSVSSVLVKTPITLVNSLDSPDYHIAYFVDATKVRVWFYRSSTFYTPTSTILGNWAEETITVRILITTENLAGAVFP